MAITNQACLATKPSQKPYKLTDGDNLYLLCAASGSKTWKWAYRMYDPVSGKVRQYDATLGRFPDLGVKDARKAKTRAAELVAAGKHPEKVKVTGNKPVEVAEPVESTLTVWAAVNGWIKLRTPEWSPSYAKQAVTYMTRYAGPETKLGRKAYAAVERPELFELIETIGQTTPAAARNVKQWLTAAFDRLVDSGRLKFSPLAGMKTRNAIPTTKTENSPVLSYPELRVLLHDVRLYRERQMSIYLELLARTCVRSSELREADWSEIDLDAALWIIPAGRMKMGRLHAVPLPLQVIHLLRELREYNGGKGWLFPHALDHSRCMVISAPREAVYRLTKKAFTPHGFRSTFSTHAHEAGKPPHVIEATLAHQKRDRVAAAYNRSTYLEERRGLMAWWSDELDKLIDSHFFDNSAIAA